MSGANAGAPAARRVRVCVVAPSLDVVGGQSIQSALLVRRLRELPALDVRFVPVNPRLPAALARLQRTRYIRTIVTTVAYVWSLLRAIPRCDVVHAFSASYFSYLLAPLPAILVARLTGRPVVLNYHSGEAADHLRRWRLSRWTMRLATQIVVPSTYLAEVFARFGVRARAIQNFIELLSLRYRHRGGEGGRARFFTNRHLEPLYNVANVLRAYALIEKERPDASLVVAGDGPLRDDLRALARELGLRNVRFTGRVEPAAMPELYDAADVFLNGSSIDNMPVSILESFAVGLPVVSTSAGGIPSVVSSEETGLLVPLDDPRALATAALRVLREPGLASRLSRGGREVCLTRYVWPAVSREWENLYRDLARPGDRRAQRRAPSAAMDADVRAPVGRMG